MVAQAQERVRAKANEDSFAYKAGEFGTEILPYLASGSLGLRGTAALAPHVPKGVRTLLHAAGQFTAGAGTTGALGGDVDEMIETGTLFSIGPHISKGLGWAARGFKKGMPEALMDSFFKITRNTADWVAKQVGATFPKFGKELVKREWIEKPLMMAQLAHAGIDVIEVQLKAAARGSIKKPAIHHEDFKIIVESMKGLDDAIAEGNAFWRTSTSTDGQAFRAAIAPLEQAMIRWEQGGVLAHGKMVEINTLALLEARRLVDRFITSGTFAAAKGDRLMQLGQKQGTFYELAAKMREGLNQVPAIQPFLKDQQKMFQMKTLLLDHAVVTHNKPLLTVMDGLTFGTALKEPVLAAPVGIIRVLGAAKSRASDAAKVVLAKGAHNLGLAWDAMQGQALSEAAVRGYAGQRHVGAEQAQMEAERQRLEEQARVRPGSRVQIDVNNLRPVR